MFDFFQKKIILVDLSLGRGGGLSQYSENHSHTTWQQTCKNLQLLLLATQMDTRPRGLLDLKFYTLDIINLFSIKSQS